MYNLCSLCKYGLVFGSESAGGLVTLPLVAKFGSSFSARTLCTFGNVVSGLTGGILLGLLHFVSDPTAFVFAGCLLRTVEGAAAAVRNSAVIGVLLAIFADSNGIVAGMVELFIGLGLMMGKEERRDLSFLKKVESSG